MRRSNSFEQVVAKMQAVRDSVGLLGLSPVGKYEGVGPVGLVGDSWLRFWMLGRLRIA